MSNLLSRLAGAFSYCVIPRHPFDSRVIARLRLGLMNYAIIRSRWGFRPIQEWIRRQSFRFRCDIGGTSRSILVSAADHTHLWAAKEVLVDEVYELNRVPFTPELIVDLGANIGAFSLLAATRWPQAALICVEPHPGTFGYLSANIRDNSVRATLLQCALDAEVAFKYLQNEGAVFQQLSTQEGAERTLCVRLDAILPPAARILIKMDIEGSEHAVLSTLTTHLPDASFIFIELHRGEESLRWVSLWARDHDFIFHETRRREDAIDGYLIRSASSPGKEWTIHE